MVTGTKFSLLRKTEARNEWEAIDASNFKTVPETPKWYLAKCKFATIEYSILVFLTEMLDTYRTTNVVWLYCTCLHLVVACFLSG